MKRLLLILTVAITCLGLPATSFAGKADKNPAAGEKAGKHGKHPIKKALKRFDTDKNGKLEGAEAEALKTAFAAKEKLRTRLAKLDKNNDGQLDDAEIAAVHAKEGKGKKNKKAGKAKGKGKKAGGKKKKNQ